MISGLASVFVSQVQNDPRISSEIAGQVTIAVEPGIDFLTAAQVETVVTEAGLDAATTAAIVEDYGNAQLQALKAGLLAAALLALASLAFTKELPSDDPRSSPADLPEAATV